MNDRLRFGIFMAPFHKPGINPTLALESGDPPSGYRFLVTPEF